MAMADPPTPTLTDTLQALSRSKLGQLRYDRDWEQQGRVQEVISDVRNRLTSLSIEPLKSELPPPEQGSNGCSPRSRPKAVPISPHNRRPSDQEYQRAECLYQHELDRLEQERKEKVRDSIAQHAREMDYHLREVEEEMAGMRLMRQQHLLATLNRIQGYKQEYESFIAELTSQQAGSEVDSIGAKMREVENKHRKAQLAQRVKALRARYADILSAREKCEAELNKISADTEPPAIHQYISDKRTQIQSLSTVADSLLAKSDLTDADCQCAGKVHAQLERIRQTIAGEVEEIRKATKTNSQPVNLAQLSPVKASAKPADAVPTETKSSGGNPLKEYIKQQAFLNNFEKAVDEDFVKLADQKAYRLSLQSFIRTTINTISGESTEHLRQKYQRLNDLLNGRTIEFQDRQIKATGHPSALNFCYSYVAKTFISVGVKQVISLPKAAFPMGAVIAILWQLHPTFGQVFFAHLVEKCPYAIGYFPVKQSDDTEISYLIACGYTYGPDNETLEVEEAFLNRMKGIMRLYAAIMQSSLGPGHPQGLPAAWQCLARILNTEPRPGVTPSILHALLTTTLYKLLACYKGQIIKLMTFIHSDYLGRIERASAQETKKQSIVQLKMFVDDALKKMRRDPNAIKPEGIIGDFFFQKSYLNAGSKFH